MRRVLALVLAVLVLGLLPAACGKRPGRLSPPESEETTPAPVYPRTYPAR